jgi:hypothetical protein
MDWYCFYGIHFDRSLVEEVIEDCLVVKKYALLESFVRWILSTETNGTLLDGLVRDMIFEAIDTIPASLKQLLVPRCHWNPDHLGKIARACSYNTLMDAIEANVKRVHNEDRNFLGAWYYWVQPLDENLLCAVHYMAARGDAKRIEFALGTDAPVVSISKQKNTPLHMVTGIGEPEVTIELLLRHGADVGVRNENDQTAVDLWRKAGKLDWV